MVRSTSNEVQKCFSTIYCPAKFWSSSRTWKCRNYFLSSTLLQVIRFATSKIEIFLDSLSIAPLHVERWTVTVTVKGSKIHAKSFFGHNSATYGLIYFKYRPQCYKSGVYLLCLTLQTFLSWKLQNNISFFVKRKHKVIREFFWKQLINTWPLSRSINVQSNFWQS